VTILENAKHFKDKSRTEMIASCYGLKTFMLKSAYSHRNKFGKGEIKQYVKDNLGENHSRIVIDSNTVNVSFSL
jgi:hypothetical protein